MFGTATKNCPRKEASGVDTATAGSAVRAMLAAV